MSFSVSVIKWRYLVLLLAAALSACSKDEQADPAAPTSAATPATPIAAPAAPAVSAQIQAMSADELRAAASKALAENRIYAPGGDNAMEYYLALRDKQPSDAAVSSALTDLMPYTLIATEQSIGREDFAEAQRLSALIEKADAKAPALPRLKQSIVTAQQAIAARAVTEETKAAADAEAKLLEDKRLAQQAEQQKAAAAALATQQQSAARAEAERTAAAQREAAATAQREVSSPRPATGTATTATAAPAPSAPAALAGSLQVVSSPAPRYPPEALRAGTSGEVLVEITVGTDGSVTSARVVRATPARIFDREALNAVKRWKFQPINAATTTRRTIAFNPG